MVATSYVKVGRLVRIIRGPREDRIGVITDIIDANRVLVQNPTDEKMWKHVQNLKNISPIKFSVSIPKNASTKVISAALAEKKPLEKFAKTKLAGALSAKAALANSTDFERYQLRVAKRSRAHWARKIFAAKDEKTPVSYVASKLKKLTKPHEKFAAKNLKTRQERIKKHFTARKAAKKTTKK
eukprot:GDKJ01034304.1.p1 GENE.GDKJ01034304.1~~GDKJ01034304.1.p1  ORF type:complete len:183 (-),score=54.81 GDKJ01034304.1:66-614(-)